MTAAAEDWRCGLKMIPIKKDMTGSELKGELRKLSGRIFNSKNYSVEIKINLR